MKSEKYVQFTNDELYILERQAIEASAEIIMNNSYSQREKDLHNKLLHEITIELKNRELKSCANCKNYGCVTNQGISLCKMHKLGFIDEGIGYANYCADYEKR